MKVLSVNVGKPREVTWKGEKVRTGIFKEPVSGPVVVRTLNLDGDQQADLSVHGGIEKAVYVYPSEHYPEWQKELQRELSWGMFGENLTTEGLLEDSVMIGDRIKIGSAEFEVRQPRMPCYKLAVKFQRDDILKLFLMSRRSGFYLSVLKEGQLEAGDSIQWISRDQHKLRVIDITTLYTSEKTNQALLKRAISVEALPESWRNHFLKQLHSL